MPRMAVLRSDWRPSPNDGFRGCGVAPGDHSGTSVPRARGAAKDLTCQHPRADVVSRWISSWSRAHLRTWAFAVNRHDAFTQ